MPLVVNGRRVTNINSAPIPQGTGAAKADERTVSGLELSGGEVDAEEFHQPQADSVVEIPENEDPARRRVVNPTHLPRWARIVRRIAPKKELSADEIAAKTEMEARKLVEQAMRADAETIARRIVNNLNAMNLCYRYPKSQRDLLTGNFLGISEVQFDAILLSPDVIQFKVRTPLPRGCDFIRMSDTTTLTTLSISLQRQVYCKYNENIGFWYIVPRSGSVMGIPGFVKYSEMMEKIPATADKLTIPLGVTLNSRRVYKSISGMPHLLVSGATGTGKSNEGNVILATLIQRNTPEDLRMILVDLKGGMEMSFYEGLPHLLPIMCKRDDDTIQLTETGIIDDRKDVPDALDWLITESERRMALLREAGYKDIGKYNARRKRGANKLARLLFFIDEYADVKLTPKIGTLVEDKLANLAARSRAVGIHIVICTQSPKKEVIGTLIKTNLPAKMAFSMPSNTASILILDNGDAKGLSPAGRMIYQNSNEQLTIQTPFMPDELLKRIVAENIKHGGTLAAADANERDVTETEVLAYALEYLGGSLNVTKLHSKFKERISNNDLRSWVQTWDGKEFEVNGSMYKVEVKPGVIGRVMVPLSEN
jgi:hypothetical protein